MSPKNGVNAFQDLLEWCGAHADTENLLRDLGQNGLEHVAAAWLSSGLVDDAQLDYLEHLCGPLLPTSARKRRQATTQQAGINDSLRTQVEPDIVNEAGKVREVLEVVGPGYGDGFILQCLLYFGGSVNTVIDAIFGGGELPPQLDCLPRGLSLNEDAKFFVAPHPKETVLSAADKREVIQQADRMELEIEQKHAMASLGLDFDIYDDEFDDSAVVPSLQIGAGVQSESDAEEDSDVADDDSDDAGGKAKGKGKYKKGSGRGQVQGQTIQARRKEEHKGKIANHNRRDQALRKMQRGM